MHLIPVFQIRDFFIALGKTYSVNCPTLASVPSFQHDLLIKATASGITVLTKRRYLQRYTGNKYSAVDINGRLYLKNSDLKKTIEMERSEGNKKGVRGPSKPQKKHISGTQISNNFSTSQTEILPKYETLSPKYRELSTRRYRVNKREVRQRLVGYMNTMKGKKELYFWTVTFPKGTTDDVCYQVFNIWLTSLRKYRMLHEYLWVAERQQNTTIHFHIAIPHKMSVHRANRMMQGTLKTFSRRGLLPFSVSQCNKYNGIDIAKNRNTRRVTNFAIKKGSRALATYLTKYVTKNDGEFKHLAWHNSRGYSALFTGVTFTVDEFKQFRFGFFLNRTRVFEIGDFAKFIPWLEGPPPLLDDHLYQLNSFIQELLN